MLDLHARALLDLIAERGIPPTHTLAPADARRLYLERRFYTQPEPPAVAEVRALDCAGVPARLYHPAGCDAGATLPGLVYFHGGGWTIGDLDTHDTLCRELANGSGCAVVSVDYRLAPEYRFPAAVDDALAATRWVCAHTAELGIDAQRIAVGGDSAGGNLAAVVAIAERDARRSPPLAFQLLIYPATDMRALADSHERNGVGYLLTRDSVAYYRGHYMGDAPWDDWRASPLLHADLRGLPPALVLVAGYDPLVDEGIAYAQRLDEAGNRASVVGFPRQIHGFVTMGRVIAEANEAVAVCASALRRALAR